MKKAIKYIDIKEFRELGYLQELNRRFLHPLGLALEVGINDDGTEYLKEIWDYRDDPEGIYYMLESSSQKRIDKFNSKVKYIDNEFEKKKSERRKLMTTEIIINEVEKIPN